MNDPLFGGIRFQKADFWQGCVYFAPAGKQVEAFIDGGAAGPGERQREFYRELERRYPSLAVPIGDLLHDTFANWKEDFPRARIWDEFELTAISIPDVGDGQLEWELSYSCASDDHSFDVQMRGWRPQEISING